MGKVCKAFFLVQITLALMLFCCTGVDAEETIPGETIKVRRAQLRTLAEMEAAEKIMLESGKVPEVVTIPFRSALSMIEYKTAKAAAAVNTGIGPKDTESPNTPLIAPVLKEMNIEGVNQIEAGGSLPPDTHGAVGLDHFVEITNQHVDTYDKSTGTRVKSVSLASFFGYTKQALFDPRCVYDQTRNRWIMAAEAFAESPTVQYQFLAISKTSDPLGSFYIYKFDTNVKDNKDFWDFPQLGMDKNAIFITGNIFAFEAIPSGSRVFGAPKSRLYSGLSVKFKYFSGLDINLAPPIVLDQGDKTVFIAPKTRGTSMKVYTLTYSSSGLTLSSSTITVPEYSLPPDAKQPGTTAELDTSDCRFVNASTQVGNSLWQVHTINNGGRPTPRFYEFNISTNTVTQSGFFSASATSHDWNASITANSGGDAFVVWSSTDPSANTNAQVRFSGRRSTDPTGAISGGSTLFTSTTFYNPANDSPERWGDYSAVTVDPDDSLSAWIVNEKINATKTWGTRIGKIGY